MTTKNRNGQTHEITFGKQRIPFEVQFRDRKRLAISVHPDRSVTVLAPEGRDITEVVNRVQKRAGWIARQRAHFEKFQPLTPSRRFVPGETHLYLGRQYRLKLIEDESASVKLVGRFFRVHLPDRDDTEKVRRLLDAWYRHHAKDIFARRLDFCLDSTRSLAVSTPEIIIRQMKKRWGSCTKSGRILLNTELVKTPLYCIEYVIMHELCHLQIHNHSRDFYRLLTRCMPDWEQRKLRLEAFVL
ncbi:MAG: M48 family peptidase [Planctomycetota bacterium]|nr:MAG: M48 family peptidase [Planctomycetota bacterium]REK28036.1 MAG: M48 family peptidase [Planctomycetota bacterium]REK37563.1 MAG: M48 family peptidase [Planctomycetota bacterium]